MVETLQEYEQALAQRAQQISQASQQVQEFDPRVQQTRTQLMRTTPTAQARVQQQEIQRAQIKQEAMQDVQQLNQEQQQLEKQFSEIKPQVQADMAEQEMVEKVYAQLQRKAEGKGGSILDTQAERDLYSKILREDPVIREAVEQGQSVRGSALSAGYKDINEFIRDQNRLSEIQTEDLSKQGLKFVQDTRGNTTGILDSQTGNVIALDQINESIAARLESAGISIRSQTTSMSVTDIPGSSVPAPDRRLDLIPKDLVREPSADISIKNVNLKVKPLPAGQIELKDYSLPDTISFGKQIGFVSGKVTQGVSSAIQTGVKGTISISDRLPFYKPGREIKFNTPVAVIEGYTVPQKMTLIPNSLSQGGTTIGKLNIPSTRTGGPKVLTLPKTSEFIDTSKSVGDFAGTAAPYTIPILGAAVAGKESLEALPKLSNVETRLGGITTLATSVPFIGGRKILSPFKEKIIVEKATGKPRIDSLVLQKPELVKVGDIEFRSSVVKTSVSVPQPTLIKTTAFREIFGMKPIEVRKLPAKEFDITSSFLTKGDSDFAVGISNLKQTGRSPVETVLILSKESKIPTIKDLTARDLKLVKEFGIDIVQPENLAMLSRQQSFTQSLMRQSPTRVSFSTKPNVQYSQSISMSKTLPDPKITIVRESNPFSVTTNTKKEITRTLSTFDFGTRPRKSFKAVSSSFVQNTKPKSLVKVEPELKVIETTNVKPIGNDLVKVINIPKSPTNILQSPKKLENIFNSSSVPQPTIQIQSAIRKADSQARSLIQRERAKVKTFEVGIGKSKARPIVITSEESGPSVVTSVSQLSLQSSKSESNQFGIKTQNQLGKSIVLVPKSTSSQDSLSQQFNQQSFRSVTDQLTRQDQAQQLGNRQVSQNASVQSNRNAIPFIRLVPPRKPSTTKKKLTNSIQNPFINIKKQKVIKVQTQVRRRGQFINIGTPTSNIQEAVKRGVTTVRGGLGRTFRLRPVGDTKASDIKINNLPSVDIFRSSRGKESDRLTFVEKNPYALRGSPGAVSEIISSRRSKGVFSI